MDYQTLIMLRAELSLLDAQLQRACLRIAVAGAISAVARAWAIAPTCLSIEERLALYGPQVRTAADYYFPSSFTSFGPN